MMFFAAVEEEEAIVASVGTERATKVCAAARDGGLFRGENGNGKEGEREREGGRALIWHLKRNDGGFPRKSRNSSALLLPASARHYNSGIDIAKLYSCPTTQWPNMK